MNKLIRELITQAGGYWNHGDFNMPSSVEFQEQDIEKFAELIVRECVRYFNEDYQRDFDTLWREDLSIGIKNHFGVEE